MMELSKYLNEAFGIDERVFRIVSEEEQKLEDIYKNIDLTAEIHEARILKAFQNTGVSDIHFGWNTGYGYDDIGRNAVERVFAKVFGSQSALVRPNIVNGTHAISLAILGIMKRGEKLIYASGKPYDTLMSTIEFGIKDGMEYQEIELLPDGGFDTDAIIASLDENVRMIAIQRSKGYSLRNSISVNQIESLISRIRATGLHIIVMVDNCYCEFVEENEPLSCGADIICGSLIKNPGGGLALTGGYICGPSDLIEEISYRLTCPGIGAECGLTFGQNRSVLQGLFQAPRVVSGALKGAVLCGRVFDKLGFNTSPNHDYPRADIIQAIELGTPEAVIAFSEGIQASSPVDSMVKPVPAPMPGYDDEIIMAAGTFVQGSSIELSCDGPLRPPYAVYFQGGLTYEHSKLGIMFGLQYLLNAGILDL